MQQYQYTLQNGGQKHLCPNCNKKRFVRYIDSLNNKLLPELYGRCDREVSCAYHLNPYTDGYALQNKEKQPYYKNTYKVPVQPKIKPKYIPKEVLMQTLKDYEQNIFIQNLLHRVAYPFEAKDIQKVIELYYLGTVSKGYQAGAITFPFIDQYKNVRAIQVKQFDKTNHTQSTSFLHSTIERGCIDCKKSLPQWLTDYKTNDKKVSCLFGEHLLTKYPHSPIALVEAPKTATYGTLYFGLPNNSTQQFLWLGVYNLSSLTFDKCKVLQGRTVCLFPDLSKGGKAFELWSKKAKEFQAKLPNTKFVVSDLLEENASTKERLEGLDLADYLIKQDWRLFRPQPVQAIPVPQKQAITANAIVEKVDTPKKEKTLPKVQTAYVDANGELYIKTPLAPTYSIYPNIEAYNKRQCLPTFKPQQLIDISEYKQVYIQLPSLLIE